MKNLVFTASCIALLASTACTPATDSIATDIVVAQREVPQFAVDPGWPTLPANWKLGIVSSVAIDAQDHVWVLHRPRTLEGAEAAQAAPPVLEFDNAGNFIQGWGGPGIGYDWPETEHGIHVDHSGQVWIAGNGTEDQILKFNSRGEFLLQIGSRDSAGGNTDPLRLGGPADTFVHAATNELFVADGYGNQRVIVYDASSGQFKRMWGAFGSTPTAVSDTEAERPEGPTQFVQPVHAARVSNDGRVYVSDRGGKRVQVFNTDGKYLQQVFIGRECEAPECGNGQTAASTAFSPDVEQRFLYVGNRSQAKVMVLDRQTLEVLDEFGHWGSAPGEFGTLHHIAADSQGNLYTTEVTPLQPENRRVQKFVFTGFATKD
ncbi:MAG: hypothetical protein V4603_10825 [Pseudomonadota bacterium]